MDVSISLHDDVETDEVIELYKVNGWSSAEKPEELMPALRNSDSLVTARVSGKLVGLGNAISDGYLVVYYPHLLVHPDFHSQGIGQSMVAVLQTKYRHLHQQMVVADGDAVDFYKTLGFERAGRTVSMWMYDGHDH